MADAERQGFDSSANVTYIHQDKGGRQPPGGGELEARVSSLEKRFERFESKLDGLIKDVSEIKGRIANMPSTWQMIGITATMIGMVLAGSAGLLAILRHLSPTQ